MAEAWKKIKEFSNYEASTHGNIRNIKTKRILKPSKSTGYAQIVLRKDNKSYTKRVHPIIAQTFIRNPKNKSIINHKNWDTFDNRVENLEFSTHLQQSLHKRKPANKKSKCRPIWRINKDTNEKLEKYDSLELAGEWVFNNKLSSIETYDKNDNKIGSFINKVMRGKKKSAYGYKWIYDIEDENKYSDEKWEIIAKKFINGSTGYKVSNYGRIKTPKGKICKGISTINGYLLIHINGITYRLHRLVAQVFLKNPENKKYVNHKDNDRTNPKLLNLEFTTPSENMYHSVKFGSSKTKKVIQFDLNMNEINKFNSLADASRTLNIKASNISACCSKKQKTAGRFIFRHFDEIYKEEVNYIEQRQILKEDIGIYKTETEIIEIEKRIMKPITNINDYIINDTDNTIKNLIEKSKNIINHNLKNDSIENIIKNINNNTNNNTNNNIIDDIINDDIISNNMKHIMIINKIKNINNIMDLENIKYMINHDIAIKK